MKHLRKYNEDLSFLKELNRLLSEEDFNKYAEEFDSIIDGFVEYADEGYELSFETAYGRRVTIAYQDYLDKNERYQEFIHGLPSHGLFFKSRIVIPYDYTILKSLLHDIQTSIDRAGDRGWVLKEFDVKGIKKPLTNSMKPRIIITHDFEKGPRP